MEKNEGRQSAFEMKTDRIQDLEGRQFGAMTVLHVFRNEKKVLKCSCRCVCGREIEVYLADLTSGRTKSCTCQSAKNKRPIKDMTGMKFGMLTPVEPTEERRYGSVVWKCRCDCGRECLTTQKALEARAKISCGCIGKPRGRTAIDLTGRRFGRLTAVRMTDARTSKGSVVWQCRCDCGKMIEVPSDSLIYGNQQSCGCLKADSMNDARRNLHFVDGTCIEWLESRKKRSDNTTGYKGISLRKNGRYLAKIGFQNRQYYLGTYSSIEHAVNARQEAETLLFESFLREYRTWEDEGREEAFHFDPSYVNEALAGLRSMGDK